MLRVLTCEDEGLVGQGPRVYLAKDPCAHGSINFLGFFELPQAADLKVRRCLASKGVSCMGWLYAHSAHTNGRK
jgi:hypothetical protein